MNSKDVFRCLFRVNWIIGQFREQALVLKNGNLASWEPEVARLNQNVEDLADTLKEFIELQQTQIQKEQGLISPPNEVAASSDTPQGL